MTTEYFLSLSITLGVDHNRVHYPARVLAIVPYQTHEREEKEMRKAEQRIINAECERAFEKAMAEYGIQRRYNDCVRLRSCNAFVYETTNFFILRSYETAIAVIDKETDTCYDVLRMVYGYTSTSAQHIAKFRHDYGSGKWGCEHEARWYDVA